MLGHAIQRDRRAGACSACGGERAANRDGGNATRSPQPAQARRDRPHCRRPAAASPSVSVPVLSKTDGVDFGEALERAAILDHDALLEQAPRGNDLHHGNGEAERAGTGDDQDRDGDGERPVDVSGCDHPADECRQRRSGGRRERKAGLRDRRCAGTSSVRIPPPPSSASFRPGTNPSRRPWRRS